MVLPNMSWQRENGSKEGNAMQKGFADDVPDLSNGKALFD